MESLGPIVKRLETAGALNPDELDEARALVRQLLDWLEEGGPARIEERLLERADRITSPYQDALQEVEKLLKE